VGEELTIAADEDDHSHCPMCGRPYSDHPACTACDGTGHTWLDCPVVEEYEKKGREP
jgi:hypothetical protein